MISYVNEALFRQNSIHKDWTIIGTDISLTNTDIFSEQISLTESICSESNVIFGSCEAAMLQFTTTAISSSFKGKTLNVSVCLDHDYENPFNIGSFIVAEETLSADKTRKDIKAYDALYEVLNKNVIAWYNGLTFPITIKNFRDAFFNHIGIYQEAATLINDSIYIQQTIDADILSGIEVLKAICEVNGVFGHIKRNGRFEYKSLSGTSVYTINSSMYTAVEYEEYSVQSITKLQIREESGDIGVIVGSGDNSYIVEDNFLLYGKDTTELTTIATALLNKISGITYIPSSIYCIGNPCLEVGDRITVTKADNTSFQTYVLQRNMTGLQALNDGIIAEGDEVYPDDVNGVHYDIIQLKGKSNVLERSIDETRQTITDVAEGLQTEITQTAAGIYVQIDDLQSQIDGEVPYYERNGVPTLLNYPYWDFTTNIPCNNTVQTTDELRFLYTKKDRQNHRNAICYDNTTNTSYRFTLQTDTDDVWYWKEITDTEYSMILARVSSLEATAEHLESEYTEMSLDLRDNYWTSTTTESRIEQTAGEITSEVSETYQTIGDMANYYTSSQTNSAINQKASEITSSVSSTYQTKSAMSNYYTKTQANSQINQKADEITASVATTYQTIDDMSNYYTSSETNTAINQKATQILSTVSSTYQTKSAMSNYYTSTQTNTAINQKSDQILSTVSTTYQTKSAMSSYYTKTETNSAINQKGDSILATVSSTYQTKSAMGSYYTKSQADLLIGAVQDDVDAAELAISAEVSRAETAEGTKLNHTRNNSSFGWSLTSSAFILKSNNTEVFKCNSSGITINGSGTFSGTITASGGNIAGWSISNSAIYKDTASGTRVAIQSDGTIVNQRISDDYIWWALQRDGVIQAKNILATGGSIGSWNISGGSLTNGKVSIQNDGNIVCYDANNQAVWALKNDGSAFFHGNMDISGYATSNYVNTTFLKTQDISTISLSASQITSGTISADRIAGGSITGGKIAAQTISAAKLELSGGYFSFGSVNVLAPSTTQIRNLYLYDGTTYHQVYLSGGYVRYN